MHKFFGKKAAIAGVAAVFILAMTAVAAFAAPPLPAGTTSYPGMSGTCTDCHTYLAAPTVKTKTVKVKATVVSHPYAAAGVHHAGRTFRVWGYVTPRLPKTTQSTTLTVQVQRMVKGSWVATSGLNATGTVSAKGRFKGKTNYSAKLTAGPAGRYRIRTRLVWLDAKGVKHAKVSKFLVIKIKK